MSLLKRYPDYKDSGVPWLGDIPSHWEEKRMRFFVSTNPLKSEVDLDKESLVSFIPMESVSVNGGLIVDDVKELDEVYKGYTYFQNGDVVLAKITPCFENGKASICNGLTNGVGFGTTELHVIRPTLNTTTEYVFYLIRSHTFMEIGESEMYGAGGQKRVPERFIKDFLTPLPPLDEQKQIVHFLDKQTAHIDTLIDKQQQLIDKLAEQRSALITHAVTKGLNTDVPMEDSGVEWLGEIPKHWIVSKMKYLGEIILGLTYSPENIVDIKQGVLVLRSSNVQDSKLSFDDCVYVDAKVSDKKITTDKDILICSRNGSQSLIGKNALITGDGVGQTFGAFMTVFRTPIRPFIYYFLNSSVFKSQIGSFLTSTINQLTTANLGRFEVSLPPTVEQEDIVKFLDEKLNHIDTLIERQKHLVSRLQEYRSALITQAVTGKIDVRQTETDSNPSSTKQGAT